jgi:hypothetical protein
MAVEQLSEVSFKVVSMNEGLVWHSRPHRVSSPSVIPNNAITDKTNSNNSVIRIKLVSDPHSHP